MTKKVKTTKKVNKTDGAGKLTIRDIARLAGVSTATVSRVLNQKPDVDPLTREHVLQIIAAHGFVPSVNASGLAGRSRLLGVLVPSFTWPFVAEILRGVTEGMKDTSYELILYSASEVTREYDASSVIDRILTTQLTAGVLAVFPGHLSKQIVRLHLNNLPVVMIDDQEQIPSVPWIGADNQNGAYMAVRHFLQLGHRRIAHIQGPAKYLCSRERHQGYCRALQEYGLEPSAELMLSGDFLEDTGYQAGRQLLSLPVAQRPTAIFVASDLMAYGVCTAAAEYGLRIPQDVALIGFDDIPSSALFRPTLTTVHQPFFEMGQLAANLLISMLNTPQRIPAPWHVIAERLGEDSDKRIQLATQLIVRESSGLPLETTNDNDMSMSTISS